MMKTARSPLVSIRGFFASLVILASIASTGCVSPLKSTRLRGDREFIQYWPPTAGEKTLRLAVKDSIDVKGVVSTAGSEHFDKNSPPAAEDAACLKAARERGVTIVGKTNLTELGLGVSGLNDYFGTPRNRIGGRQRLMPGGSSSGSAVAVANGKADIAFGTDTSGSIRTPAACCGIYGLKTTFGSLPMKGILGMSPKNLGTVGPMARDIPHLVEGMDLLKPGFAGEYRHAAADRPSGRSIRVGRLYIEGTDPVIDQAVDDELRRAGFQVVRLSPPFAQAWKEAEKHAEVVAVVDAHTSYHHLLSEKGVTLTTKAAILMGDLKDGDNTYGEAMRYRAVWRRMLRDIFRKVDLIALPTLKGAPLKVPFWGRWVPFEARALALQNAAAVNYAGNPALAMPIPMNDPKLPVTSLQLIGPKLGEAEIVNAARILASARE